MDSGSDDEGGSMWSRGFTFGKDIKVRVEEEWGLGIGGTVWEGGVLLARYLSSAAFSAGKFQGKRCIEIGAGITGLPSIAAAHQTALGQIVVTDIDECIEALADNMAPNLPEGCCLRTVHPSSEAQQPSAADPSSVDGWDLPQSIIQVAAQDFPIDQAASQRHSEQPLEGQNAAPQPAECDVPADERHSEASGCILSLENLHIGNGSSDHQHADHSGGNSLEAKIDLQQSEGLEVVVRSLDWREDPQHLSPPFDLVLVADVSQDLPSVPPNLPSVTGPSLLKLCPQQRPLQLHSEHGALSLSPKVYIEELMEPLVQCMHKLCSQKSTVLLAYYERSKAAGAVFWKLLPNFFTFQKVPEASFGAGAHPDHVGLFLLRKL